jgi:uncharacterized membrane protein
MLLTYFLYNSETVPVAPIITGIAFVFTFHMRCVSVVRSLYFTVFSAVFCKMLSVIHIAPQHFSYSPSVQALLYSYRCMFRCILVLATTTVSERSA